MVRQSLVCLVVIDVKFSREDHSSIPRNSPLDVRTDPEPDSTNGGKKKTINWLN
jgi:hypothetical protein